MPEELEQFILFCPCCNSTLDVEKLIGDPEQEQEFECGSCGQIFKMVISVDRQAANSIV